MSFNTFQDLSFLEGLPKNWVVRKFSDIFNDVSGGNAKLQKTDFQSTGKYPIIDQGQSIIAGYTSDASVLCNAKLPVIVFGDHTRAFKYIDFEFVMGADGTKVLQQNSVEKVEAKYVYHFLNSVKLPDKGYSRHFKYLKDVAVPLPPLPEQKRIAAILDKAEEIKRKRKESIKLADEFLKSVFVDMFGDPVTNPKGWEETTIGESCHFVKDGPHVSPHYTESGKLFISVNNIIKGDWDFSNAKYISVDDYEKFAKRCKPEKGDILYTKGGTTGFAKLIDIDVDFINWVHLAVLKFDHSKLNGRFFEAMLNSNYCYTQSQRYTRGIANRDLVLGQMKQIKFFLPPIKLQEKFAKISEFTRAMKKKNLRHLEEAKELCSSLSQVAFKGDL